MDDQTLAEVYAFALQLGKDAGDMLMAAARRRIEGGPNPGSSSVAYVEKENSVDIVTKTDNGGCRVPHPSYYANRLDVEHFIRSSVKAKYPDHA